MFVNRNFRMPGTMVLAICLGLAAFVMTPPRIDGAPGVNPAAFAVQLRTAYREIPHTRPWQITGIERSLRPAVYLGNGTFLSFEPAMDRAVGSTLRFAGDFEISAHLLHRDRQLGLGLLRIDEQGDEAGDWRAPPRTVLAESMDLRGRGTALHLIGYGKNRSAGLRRHTVFLEGMRAGEMPAVAGKHGRKLPLMQFSGWTPGIRPGDLLFAERGGRPQLAGIVVRFHENDRYGFALPAPLLAGYVEQALAISAKQKAAEKSNKTTQEPPPADSVVSDPGFRAETIGSRTARAYYGLAPGSKSGNAGAMLVTRVMPYLLTLRDRVEAGDVIVGVNGRPLGPGGTIDDPLYGPLSLEALLGFAKGRPQAAGTRVRLDIIRKRERRTVKLELHPHRKDYVRVPEYFERPAYLIAGGLVFVELSERYLQERSAAGVSSEAPRLKFLARARQLLDRPEKSRYVILDRILPVPLNADYRAVAARRPLLLLSLNGVAVRDLAHLNRMLQEHLAAGRDLALGLEDGRLIVLPGADRGVALKQADSTVRARHGIPYLQANLLNQASNSR
ncbi:MAG: hypothetical protein NXI24_20180 [bacterium]|nr:hypothetical protein [bacterium]